MSYLVFVALSCMIALIAHTVTKPILKELEQARIAAEGSRHQITQLNAKVDSLRSELSKERRRREDDEKSDRAAASLHEMLTAGTRKGLSS